MNKFRFEMDRGICRTPCNFRHDEAKVGSRTCRDCNLFVAINEKTGFVVCNAKLVCPICGSVSSTIEDLNQCVKKCECIHSWEYELYDLNSEEIQLGRRCEGCWKFEEKDLPASAFDQQLMKVLWNG